MWCFTAFMFIVGLLSCMTIIFYIVCKLHPSILQNETVYFVYDFIVGYQSSKEP